MVCLINQFGTITWQPAVVADSYIMCHSHALRLHARVLFQNQKIFDKTWRVKLCGKLTTNLPNIFHHQCFPQYGIIIYTSINIVKSILLILHKLFMSLKCHYLGYSFTYILFYWENDQGSDIMDKQHRRYEGQYINHELPNNYIYITCDTSLWLVVAAIWGL